MAKRLYVGNLLHALTQEELAEAFAAWGPVQSASIVVDHATGQSRGFGFVELPDDKALEAVGQMNGARLRGRPLVVNEARPREARQPGTGPSGSYRSRDESAAGGYRGREDAATTGYRSREAGPSPAPGGDVPVGRSESGPAERRPPVNRGDGGRETERRPDAPRAGGAARGRFDRDRGRVESPRKDRLKPVTGQRWDRNSWQLLDEDEDESIDDPDESIDDLDESIDDLDESIDDLDESGEEEEG